MALIESLRMLLGEHPEVWEDMYIFLPMKISETLRVTNPNEYVAQCERLQKIQSNYETAFKKIIEDNVDMIVKFALKDLTTYSSYPLSTDTISARNITA